MSSPPLTVRDKRSQRVCVAIGLVANCMLWVRFHVCNSSSTADTRELPSRSRSADIGRNPLGRALADFSGREREVEALLDLLEKDGPLGARPRRHGNCAIQPAGRLCGERLWSRRSRRPDRLPPSNQRPKDSSSSFRRRSASRCPPSRRRPRGFRRSARRSTSRWTRYHLFDPLISGSGILRPLASDQLRAGDRRR